MTRPLQMTCGASWVSAQLGYTPPPLSQHLLLQLLLRAHG